MIQYSSFGSACECSRNNLNSFAAFGADPNEAGYDHSRVNFDPIQCENTWAYNKDTKVCDPNMFAFFDTVNSNYNKALGKLFQTETNRWFSKADNKLWDLLIFNGNNGINQKLSYLVTKYDGAKWILEKSPLATVTNLRFIKKTLLADWRDNKSWWATVFLVGKDRASINMATIENLKSGNTHNVYDPVTKTTKQFNKRQILNLLKRNNPDIAFAPAYADRGVEGEYYVNPEDPRQLKQGSVKSTPWFVGQSPFCGTGNVCDVNKIRATRKTYSGFSSFGTSPDYEYDSEGYDYSGESDWGSFYDQQSQNDGTAEEIRQTYSENQLVDSFTKSSFDDRTGYWVDKALGVAFDVAGNALGLWDGQKVVNKTGQVIPPPSSGVSMPVLIGGGLLLALILLKK